MAAWIVRVEAVNFAATVLDTNDLSTIRGGGLACLRVAEPVRHALAALSPTAPDLIFSGASQCAFRIETDRSRTAIEDAVRAGMRVAEGAPHAFMMHVVDAEQLAAPGGSAEIEQALVCLEARNRTRQFRQWTQVPIVFSAAAQDADRMDGVSPATERAYFPKGRQLLPEDDDGDRPEADFELRSVSPSVKARRDFGRKARERFYGQELGGALPGELRGADASMCFAQSLQDIVAEPPAGPGLSVQNKIAVVYADGNGFGAARRHVGTQAFSRQLWLLRRELLAHIVTWLVDGARGELGEAFAVERLRERRPVRALRFETILWGGDEMAFVLPAWLATAFVERLLAWTAGWQVRDPEDPKKAPYDLTHAVAVAIGHVKTPIRQLRAIAKEAADAVKDAAKEAGWKETSSATFEIFESLHPPDAAGDGALDRWRKSVLGARADGGDLARKLVLPGDAFADVLARMRRIVDGDRKASPPRPGFPRSQLYAVLRELRAAGEGLGEPGADARVEAILDKYLRRAGMDRGATRGDLDLPEMPGVPRGIAMSLALIATLWDYADPFGQPLPGRDAPSGRAA